MAHIADLYPPDYATAVGQVRLLIPDTEELQDPADTEPHAHYIFSDAQIQAFVALYSGNVKRAAAQAKLGAELRAQAKQLQDEAEAAALKASANEKLLALGLTEEEIAAIVK